MPRLFHEVTRHANSDGTIGRCFIIITISLFFVHCRMKAFPKDLQFTLSCASWFHIVPLNFLTSSLHLTLCLPLLHLTCLGNRSVARNVHWLSVLRIAWPAQVHFFCSMSTKISATLFLMLLLSYYVPLHAVWCSIFSLVALWSSMFQPHMLELAVCSDCTLFALVTAADCLSLFGSACRICSSCSATSVSSL